MITVCTVLSYRLECLFRHDPPALAGLGRPGLAYPGMTLAAIVCSMGLQGPRMGRLFLGTASHTVGFSASRKRIAGTTVDTVHCFQEPTDPISSVDGLDVCTAKAAVELPTP